MGEIIGNFFEFDNVYLFIDDGKYIYGLIGNEECFGKYKLFDFKFVVLYGNIVVEFYDLNGF